MITVEFLGPIQKPVLSMEASSLHEVARVLKEDTEMGQWIESCAVAVNDILVSSLDTELHDGDRVSLLPPVCGG
ncbi:MAG TPA: MoaD/ThiS family protein [Sulfuricurvum sp.]|nr:MoaD/ThiS family protein [Sulfuricurvum sp.]